MRGPRGRNNFSQNRSRNVSHRAEHFSGNVSRSEQNGFRIIPLRNKNVMIELLLGGAQFDHISIVDNLKEDPLTQRILAAAESRNIRIEKVPYKNMDYGRSGESHEVLMAYVSVKDNWSFEEMLDFGYKQARPAFILILNKVGYANNLGAIARTAFASGVTGIIYHGEKEQIYNEETIHFSLGTLARIPIVRMSTFEALKELKKIGIKTYSLQMGGTVYYEENLKGAVAIVLGNEGDGVSETVSDKCDKKISIPMKPGIDSLNVSASAAVIMYEKARQEGVSFLK